MDRRDARVDDRETQMLRFFSTRALTVWRVRTRRLPGRKLWRRARI